ncbi:MAG: helix-turn-helix transcriptional regulator [Magnetococcales bacterium]|nr:helix-turn-helix transcriptional regulator [Magnetococcales bacterium]
MNTDNLFGRRLRQARKAVGISQRALGIKAGLDEFVASSRINRYEQGVHRLSDILLIERISAVLCVPISFFFARDDDEAEIMRRIHQLDPSLRYGVIKCINNILESGEADE